MITLFVFSSLEAWPTLMFHILDGCEYKKGKEQGPRMNCNLTYGVPFCLLFIIIGSFFFMNLFVGVIFDEFAHQKELENSAFKNMTEA